MTIHICKYIFELERRNIKIKFVSLTFWNSITLNRICLAVMGHGQV